ncbi:MAG: hypothetical protein IKU01_06655 [Bacteroidales bacterium]|nr:hypothetical protein [Bacteroidales bacterium]
MDYKSTLFLQDNDIESEYENVVRQSLKEAFKNERPSRNVLDAIMSFAASYDCIDTQIGKVEIMFN